MPSKNLVREFLEGGVYHVYNRGINKQNIFFDEKDYATFLFYIKLYLDDPDKLKDLDPQKKKSLVRRNFYGNINLLCYCLMPNHFHLLVKQEEERDLAEFMRCVLTNYSMYFNKKYNRLGPVFQGTYKAILVKDDAYLLHLSRYIHLNPVSIIYNEFVKGVTPAKLADYPYSSYADYLGNKNTTWVKPSSVLDYFKDNKRQYIISESSYQEFIEDSKYDSKNIIGDLAIES